MLCRVVSFAGATPRMQVVWDACVLVPLPPALARMGAALQDQRHGIRIWTRTILYFNDMDLDGPDGCNHWNLHTVKLTSMRAHLAS